MHRQVNRASCAVFRWGLLLLSLTVLPGCAEYFWSETIVSSDGSIERWICQPKSALPGEAFSGWQTVKQVASYDDQSWPESFESLSPVADEEASYVAAQGRFTSVDEIPDHFVVPAPGGTKHGTLLRGNTRTDYGLFVEHAWTETLTDTFELTDMLRARRELAQLILENGEQLAELAYPDMDASRLFTWGRDEGVQWFEELVDALVAASTQADRDEEVKRRFREISARHGLDLTGEAGAPPLDLDDEILGQRVRAFCGAKLLELLRDRQGRPLSEQRVAALLDELLPAESPSDGQPTRLQKLADEYVVQKYGSQERYSEQLLALGVRILGVHQMRLGSRDFRYVVQLPGLVVESTGRLIGEHRVQFDFAAADAFPFGYRMACRSLEPNESVQARVLPAGRRITERGPLMQLRALMDADEGLADVLREAARVGSLDPIRRHLDQSSLSTKQLADLNALLGLTP